MVMHLKISGLASSYMLPSPMLEEVREYESGGSHQIKGTFFRIRTLDGFK